MIPSNPPLAVFADVAVRYGEKTILESISFEIADRSIFAVLGRNGAGKSSLLRCLLGLQSPSSGTVALFEQNPRRDPAALMRRVGVVPEEPDAPPQLSVGQLVRLCGALHPRWDAKSVNGRLQRMRVPADVAFGSLSKGQKTSTMLALALGHDPEFLVLDDPTLGLDVAARRLFVDELIIATGVRPMTIVVTTHDLASIERFADRVAILGGGRLLLNESLPALRSRYRRIRGPKDANFDGFTIVRKALHPWGSEAIVSDFTEPRFAEWRAGREGVETMAVPLEDIFLSITGEGHQS